MTLHFDVTVVTSLTMDDPGRLKAVVESLGEPCNEQEKTRAGLPDAGFFVWCRGEDLNLHGVTPTST